MVDTLAFEWLAEGGPEGSGRRGRRHRRNRGLVQPLVIAAPEPDFSSVTVLDACAVDDGADLLEGAGKKNKKKKKKAKAPAAPIAGYDELTGAPVYDEIIGYDAKTGKPRYAAQEARRQALLAQATPQYQAPQYGAVGGVPQYDERGNPIAPPSPAYPQQFAQQPPPPPPGWTPQQWAQYLATQQTAQNLAQGVTDQPTSFDAFIDYSGASPSGPGFQGGEPDLESVSFGLEDDQTAFVEGADFDYLEGASGDAPSSPLFAAVGARASLDNARAGSMNDGAARGATLGNRQERRSAGGFLSRAIEKAAAAASPMFRAVSGAGCHSCTCYKKYPPRDAIRDPL